jgi:hypothetical protein
MPYRRLPTTDLARLRAMEALLAQPYCLGNGAKELVISKSNLVALRNFHPRFQSAVLNFNAAQQTQSKRSREYTELVKRARLYLSHFIQVMNMAIARNELKPEIRKYYQLSKDEKAIPNLISENSIAEWCKIIIDGDQKRVMAGGSPIYNPSIALVKVNYEKFYAAWKNQKVLQANTRRILSQVADLRNDADKLIQQLWNEVETFYGSCGDEEMRKKATGHGLVYVFRKSELNKTVPTKQQPALKIEPEKIALTRRILPEEVEAMHAQTAEKGMDQKLHSDILQSVIPFGFS